MVLDIDETAHPVVHFIVGSCGIASPSERGSAPAKFTFRFVSLTTASTLPHREGKWLKQFDLVSALGEGDIHIGFGIMGGWNQAQAHAQFVANVVDYGMNVQAALEQARFTKGTFEGCDVQMENTISASVRDELTSEFGSPGVN